MLNFVIALKAEAKPLIDAFQLTHQPDKYYPVFASEDKTLVVSGMGRNQAAAATAWLAARRPAKVWLNIGIAGHADQKIGTLLAAHKITEYHTAKSWYPVHIKSPVATAALTTFDSVQRNYLATTLHDMEASAFYQTAVRFSIAELTHSVKIVSDNNLNPVDTLDKALVENLIASQLTQITDLCQHLCCLANETEAGIPAAMIDLYLKNWKFTVTQQHQLQRLLRRRAALGLTPAQSSDLDSADKSGGAPIPEALSTLSDSKSVLRWLQRDTDNKAEYY